MNILRKWLPVGFPRNQGRLHQHAKMLCFIFLACGIVYTAAAVHEPASVHPVKEQPQEKAQGISSRGQPGEVESYQVERKPLAYETIVVQNAELEKGEANILKEGKEGLVESTYQVSKENENEEVLREEVSTRVIQPPTNEVKEVGGTRVPSREGRDYELEEAATFTVTAYCPGTPGSGCPVDSRGASHCTGHNNDGYTFSGTRATAGEGTADNPHIIAVDPSVIPLESTVYIEGHGFARAEDTGSAIQGKIIDLLFDDHAEASSFGRQQLRVYLLSE